MVRLGVGSALTIDAPAGGSVLIEGLAIVQQLATSEGGNSPASGAQGDKAQAQAAMTEVKEAAERGEAETEAAGYAVCVRRGDVVLTRCTVRAAASGCIFISASAVADLRCCELQQAAAHGVLVSGRARVALRHCQVRRSSRVRAHVHLHTHVSLRAQPAALSGLRSRMLCT